MEGVRGLSRVLLTCSRITAAESHLSWGRPPNGMPLWQDQAKKAVLQPSLQQGIGGVANQLFHREWVAGQIRTVELAQVTSCCSVARQAPLFLLAQDSVSQGSINLSLFNESMRFVCKPQNEVPTYIRPAFAYNI